MATQLDRLTEPETEEESPITFETVWACVRRFWLLLILATVAGAFVAYYYAGQQPYMYTKSASVMLKDAKMGVDNSSDKIMRELGVDSSASNLANESCILKSTSLMARTVEALGVNISYWQPHRFRLIDLYKETPLIVEFSKSSDALMCEMSITPEDDQHYSVTYDGVEGEPITVRGTFREALQLPFANITVHTTPNMSEFYHGTPIVVRRAPVLDTARALLKSLSVQRPIDERDSSLLVLTMTETNPQKVGDVLDKLIEVYNQNSRDAKGEAARKTEKFIRERLVDLGASLSDVDEKIATQRTKDEVMVSTEQSITADYTTTQAINQEMFELEMQLKFADELGETLNKSGHSAEMIALDSGVLDSSILNHLQGYNEAYLEYQRVASSAGSKNPVVVALRSKMQASLTAAKRALMSYKNNVELKIKELENKKKTLEEHIVKSTQHEQSLTPLVREHKVKEELYMLLLQKEQENALSLVLATPSAVVLESAYGSDAPVAPETRRYVLIGSGLGFAICLSILLAYTVLNNKVKSRRDLVGKTFLPVIGELPRLSRKDKMGIRVKQALVTDERGPMSEYLHILRNNAESMVPHEPGRGIVYLFTSTVPGEGKTFVSANLGLTFAKTGRRVLLLDFDFRKRSLSHLFGGKGRRGITSLLLNQVADVSEVLHQIPNTSYRVDIVYSGPPVPNPVTLLTQPKVKQLIEDARRHYDVIILDCPPYNVLADTPILAPFCDATLYLMRSGFVSRNYVSYIQKLVMDKKLPPLGFIINDVDFRAAGHYPYGYGYGYGSGTKKAEDQERAAAEQEAREASKNVTV